MITGSVTTLELSVVCVTFLLIATGLNTGSVITLELTVVGVTSKVLGGSVKGQFPEPVGLQRSFEQHLNPGREQSDSE